MAINYSGVTIGTFTLCQKREETVNGELVEVKDARGRQVYNKFRIQLRESNCLMCALHVMKVDNPRNPRLCWRHDIVSFFIDEDHLRRMKEDYKPGCFFSGLFSGELKDIRLNLFYKENNILMKHMIRDGLDVTCYYEKPKPEEL